MGKKLPNSRVVSLLRFVSCCKSLGRFSFLDYHNKYVSYSCLVDFGDGDVAESNLSSRLYSKHVRSYVASLYLKEQRRDFFIHYLISLKLNKT